MSNEKQALKEYLEATHWAGFYKGTLCGLGIAIVIVVIHIYTNYDTTI